jgi:VanZ family protein
VRRLRLLLWSATIGWWVLLATLTHLPLDRYIPEQQKQMMQFLDKPEHFIAYFILTALIGCSLAISYPHRRHPVWLAVPLCMAYGAIDEWTQAWVNRTCSLNDWFANVVGIVAGVVPVLLFRRALRRRTDATGQSTPRPQPGDPARTPA